MSLQCCISITKKQNSPRLIRQAENRDSPLQHLLLHKEQNRYKYTCRRSGSERSTLILRNGWPQKIWAAIRTKQSRNGPTDRKSTRLNSSHVSISYAVFCLKK